MRTITLILLLTLSLCCYAEFPIGNFTYMKSYHNRDVYPLIADAGYTFIISETMPDRDASQELLDTAGKYGLKVALIDRYELYEYSRSNYMCFEAENGPDYGEAWYTLGQEMGRAEGENWVCDSSRDKAGNVIDGMWYRKNGAPFDNTFNLSEKDDIYFRVRLSWSADGYKIPPGHNVLQANLYCYPGGDRAKPLRIPLAGTQLLPKHLSEEPKDYIFSCPLARIPENCRRLTDNGWMIYGLDFRLRWGGLGVLEIDRLEIYDSTHERLRDGELTANILTRVAQLAESPHLMGIFVKDESCTPQYESIRLIKEITDRNPEVQVPFLTVNWVRQYEKSDGGYIPWEDFLETTNLGYIAPDIYPVRGNLHWNSNPQFRAWHIQNKLDEMTDMYRMNKQSALRHDAKFFAIVQSTGYWHGNSLDNGEWASQILPPPEMIKCLRYLPLCYSAQGIMDWRMLSNRRKKNSENWKYSFHQSPIDIDNRTTPQYDAIMESNERISEYGEILDCLEWIGAHHDPKEIAGLTPALRKVEVKSTQPGRYEGHIEVGLFQDESLYLMVVNRRTNFLKPEYGDSNGVPETVGSRGEDVARAFEVAPDQTLTLRFTDDFDHLWYLEEVISGERIRVTVNHSATITLPAGEGRLYRLMAESDPSGRVPDHR